MNQSEYREFAKAANVLGRSVIEETIDVVLPSHPKLAKKLQSSIERGPIEKPEKHEGGKETDLFRVVLQESEVEAIVELFGDLEVFVAKEVVPDLSGIEPSFTLEQWCERLIRYAENDA